MQHGKTNKTVHQRKTSKAAKYLASSKYNVYKEHLTEMSGRERAYTCMTRWQLPKAQADPRGTRQTPVGSSSSPLTIFQSVS